MPASTQTRKPFSPETGAVHGTARTTRNRRGAPEACDPAPAPSFYELHPEALDRAVARRQLADELLDGLHVCNYTLGTPEDLLETNGSRALRQELQVLLDRIEKKVLG